MYLHDPAWLRSLRRIYLQDQSNSSTEKLKM
uniref:Uncharacterized protein n=1 Tax=Rhizophora mucronata TaxID=61149 RepID=A0A2P2Q4P6_RHIMU